MQAKDYRALVARLEQESQTAPGAYRAKVAGLAVLGFGILALFIGAVGFGLVALVGAVVAVAFMGGTALLLIAKLGKLLFFLAIPMWYMLKHGVQALFIRLPAPGGRPVTRSEAPALFAALDDMRKRMRGPRVHHVLLVDDVNAAMVQRPALGLVGFPRNYLLLGLPLLECMPAPEALAVVAHEYGHLAGAHGHFSSFIYRLRHTWGTVQAYSEHIQGWLGRLVAPLVGWYAPYFNAYTFVLARANEYEADAASARLVGRHHAAHALKRVNVVAPFHEKFMETAFSRIEHDPAPPADILQRWASAAAAPLADADTGKWLRQALDRRGSEWDTHPTLRLRLEALAVPGEDLAAAPPLLAGPSAAQEWFGPSLPGLRRELESAWEDGLRQPWIDRHHERRKQRERLQELRAMESPGRDEQIEAIQLAMTLEPGESVLEPLERFNAQHSDHALGLFLEGAVRLDAGDAAGLALLDRAIVLDAECTKPACERACAFLREAGDLQAMDAWSQRWSERDARDTLVARQLDDIRGKDILVPHGLADDVVATIRQQLQADGLASIREVWLARRVIPADRSVVQLVLCLRLTRWAEWRGRQAKVVGRIAAIAWPQPLLVLTLDHQFAPLRKQLKLLASTRLV